MATAAGELPESWCHDPAHDEFYNSPLCWSHALDVVASVELEPHRTKASPRRRLDTAAEAEARGA